jgi:hypothetical protein
MSNTPPGTRWGLSEFLSPARLDRKGWTHLPGATAGQPNDSIQSLDPIYPNMAVVCTATGATFTKDQVYIRNSDNTQWLGGGGGKHYHDSDTDAAGGWFRDIVFNNLHQIYWENLINPRSTDFQKEGGGSISDTTPGRVIFNAPATAGTYVSGGRAGVPISFVSKSKFLVRMNVDAANQLTARVGVNPERVDMAVGGDVIQKYGLEVCDSAGNPQDWSIFAAAGSGSRATATMTNQSVAPGSVKAYRLIYTPGTDIKSWVNGALSVTLTNGIPSGGTSGDAVRNIGVGIRANSNTARNLYLHGIAFVGAPTTATWQ